MARVLIVDDEENIRIALREFLEQDGHNVETSQDAYQALQSLNHTNFDVVVTDIAMPGLSGRDLLVKIQELAKGIQVIMITGEPTAEAASKAILAGAFDYLPKPVHGKDLQWVVGKAAKAKALFDQSKHLAPEHPTAVNSLHYPGKR